MLENMFLQHGETSGSASSNVSDVISGFEPEETREARRNTWSELLWKENKTGAISGTQRFETNSAKASALAIDHAQPEHHDASQCVFFIGHISSGNVEVAWSSEE